MIYHMDRNKALALAEHLRSWMSDLKVGTRNDFLPAEVCCDMTGIVPFRRCMADQILLFLDTYQEQSDASSEGNH